MPLPLEFFVIFADCFDFLTDNINDARPFIRGLFMGSGSINNPEKKYLNTIFVIETEFTYKNDNGDMVEGKSRDNYGGLRYFVNIDESGNIIRDESGQPILERLWSGDGSGFGKLFALTQKYDPSVRSYSDFFNFWKQDGIKVKIKTHVNNFSGKQYSKNIIT